MDLDVTSLLEAALQQGIWAALYIYLFFRMLKENASREERYQNMIDRLSSNIENGMIYGLDGKEFSVQEEDKQKDIFVDETKIRAILTERQFKRLTLYVIRGMTVEQIAEQEGVTHQNVSKSIRQAKKKIKFFFEKQGAKVPF